MVGVLGFGLYRAGRSHEELEFQFVRLVEHDLKLADQAEVLLRLTSDLETGKRGFLLTGDQSFLTPYNQARATSRACSCRPRTPPSPAKRTRASPTSPAPCTTGRSASASPRSGPASR